MKNCNIYGRIVKEIRSLVRRESNKCSLNMYKQYKDDELKKVHHVQKEILKEFDQFCEQWDLKYFLVFGTLLGAVRHRGFIPWDDDIDVGMERKEYDRFLELSKEHFNSNYEVLTPLIDKNYCSSVTHLQKKGTKFVSEFAKDLKCDLGINIDIFAFDHVTLDEKLWKKQLKKTYFYGRLLYLRGSGRPEINIKGIVGLVAKMICYMAHCGLVLFRTPSRGIYKNLIKWSIKYNTINSESITCFEDATPWKNIIHKKDLYPLGRIEFEDIMVNAPKDSRAILTTSYGDYMEFPPEKERVNHCPVILEFGDEDE